MKKIRCLLWLLPLLFFGVVHAQKNTITGKVVDKLTGEPLQSANVVLEKSKIGVNTKLDGTFTIVVPVNKKNLIVSFLGYATQIIPIEGLSVVNVALVQVAAQQNEVVVIGYGTQKKSSVTGAVSKYKSETLDEAPVSRLDQALQGKIAGVQIQNVSSEAGSDPKVRIRGLSSINAGSDPLVVVDGHPVPDGLAFVNMADVESVEVLKDAASAAIYGSRGASGVILITTKSGKADKARYNFKMSNGAKTAYKKYDRMTTTDYVTLLFNEKALKITDPDVNTKDTAVADPDRAAYVIENEMMHGPQTDWQNEVIRTTSVKNLQLNISGGNKDVKYYLSGAYQSDGGIMRHSQYDRYNIRGKLDAKLNDKVKISFNVNPSYNKKEMPSVNFTDFLRYPSWMPVLLKQEDIDFIHANPLYTDTKVGDYAQQRYWNANNYSGTMPDGTTWASAKPVDITSTVSNAPSSVLDTRKITSDEYRVLTSTDVTINIRTGLIFKSTLSAYVNYTTGLDFAKKNSNRAGDVSKGVYSSKLFIDLLNENTLNYSKKINAHTFNVLAGFTAQKTKVTQSQTTGLNFVSDDIANLNDALAVDLNNSYSRENNIGLISYLSRMQYSYADKYLFSASFRSDGSSYFAKGHQWGYFPSVSLGWVASREKFVAKIGWIDNLKFRASYGATGNNKIGDFAYVNLLYPANYAFGEGNGALVRGQLPSQDVLSNANITWERTFQLNGGVDVAVLNNRLTFSVDVYQSKTDQLLLKQAVMGFAGVPLSWNNIGRVQTNGIEFEVTSNNIKSRGLLWTTSANISHTRNKVLALGEEALLLNQGERNELYMNQVGNRLVQFVGYKTDGVWLSQAQIDAQKASGLTSDLSNVFVPGGLKLVDVNGDNVIDEKDRTVIGNPYPDFTWGVTNNFKFKGFDLNILVQGVQGGSIINGDPNYLEIRRTSRVYTNNRWLSPMFPGDGKTPYSSNGFNWMLTDYVVEDASYYALREVLLGYTIPAKWIKRTGLTSLRIYFSAQNLFFHAAKKYRGLNPEARSNGGPYATPLVDGYQRGAFPINKTFLFGIDLNL